MIIGVDLDGFINTNRWYNGKKWLPEWIILMALIVLELAIPPNKGVIAAIRGWKDDGDTIHILSARPEAARLITEIWLSANRVSYNYLHLVGVGKEVEQRKLEITKKYKTKRYFDDDAKTVQFLKDNGVWAHYYGMS